MGWGGGGGGDCLTFFPVLVDPTRVVLDTICHGALEEDGEGLGKIRTTDAVENSRHEDKKNLSVREYLPFCFWHVHCLIILSFSYND